MTGAAPLSDPDNTGCDAHRPSGTGYCGDPVTATFTSGCVHEHLWTMRVCAHHEHAVRAANRSWCRDCEENGHPCLVTVTWHPVDA